MEGRQPRQRRGKGRGEDTAVGLGPSREAPEERGRAHGKKKRGRLSGRGLWTPQLRQGLHGLLASGAGEGIQRLLLDLPLDRAPQRTDEGPGHCRPPGPRLPSRSCLEQPLPALSHLRWAEPAHCSDLSGASVQSHQNTPRSNPLHPSSGLSKNCFCSPTGGGLCKPQTGPKKKHREGPLKDTQLNSFKNVLLISSHF